MSYHAEFERINRPDRPLLCRHFPYGNSTARDCPHLNGGDR